MLDSGATMSMTKRKVMEVATGERQIVPITELYGIEMIMGNYNIITVKDLNKIEKEKNKPVDLDQEWLKREN